MTAPTDEFVAIAQRTQEATATAVRTWAETAKQYSGHVTIENPLPRPAEVHTAVDAWFDLIADLVTEQRAFTKSLIEAGTEAIGTVAEQAGAAASSLPVNPFTAAQAGTAPRADQPAGEATKRTRSARGTTS